MAQKVKIAGALFSDVPSISVPDDNDVYHSFVDINDTTATASDVASGEVFYTANGTRTVGTAVGGTSNTWYGTSPTGASTQAKEVTTVTGDFTLTTGNMVRVKFTNAQTYNGAPTLNVDATGAISTRCSQSTTTPRYMWSAGEVVDFVYDGTSFVISKGGLATTTYYGLTKLSSAVNSTSTSLSATASAVKQAYDLANSKQAELVSGTNIKTVNGNSLLGSGDITISGGGSTTIRRWS